jgi:hypothetical protein
MSAIYEQIGGSHGATRRQDARIAALIDEALGNVQSVVNVGAGAGAYEPTNRAVLAIEPSETMIAQRPPQSAQVIQASAERLPLADASFDAALAVNTESISTPKSAATSRTSHLPAPATSARVWRGSKATWRRALGTASTGICARSPSSTSAIAS